MRRTNCWHFSGSTSNFRHLGMAAGGDAILGDVLLPAGQLLVDDLDVLELVEVGGECVDDLPYAW